MKIKKIKIVISSVLQTVRSDWVKSTEIQARINQAKDEALLKNPTMYRRPII